MPLPTFIIAGAPKCGTTALWSYFKEHPAVFMTNPIKEPRFFSDAKGELEKGTSGAGPIRSGTFGKGINWYKSLFNSCGEGQVCGEASTQYFSDVNSPNLIKSIVPDVKLIFLLRHPVERVYSHYWQEYKLGLKFPDFTSMVSNHHPRFHYYCNVSSYQTHMERYYNVFAKNHVLVLLNTDLKQEPVKMVQKAFKFIDVDPSFVPASVESRFNLQTKPRFRFLQGGYTRLTSSKLAVKIPERMRPYVRIITRFVSYINSVPNKMPPLPKQIRAQLTDRFRDDIAYVEELLNRDLTTWRK